MSGDRFSGAGSIAEVLGDREVAVIASTNQLARDGHVVEPSGIDLSGYRVAPVILFNHDSARPVGVATHVGLQGTSLGARIQFADAGISQTADEVCALTKSGILSGVSIGFMPTETEPLDSRDPWGGQHITACDLIEISIVATPSDTGAHVVARSFDSAARRAMIRSLAPVRPEAIARAVERIRAATYSEPHPWDPYRSTREAAQAWQQRCMTGWAHGKAREAEDQERRRQRVAELEAIGEAYEATRQ